MQQIINRIQHRIITFMGLIPLNKQYLVAGANAIQSNNVWDLLTYFSCEATGTKAMNNIIKLNPTNAFQLNPRQIPEIINLASQLLIELLIQSQIPCIINLASLHINATQILIELLIQSLHTYLIKLLPTIVKEKPTKMTFNKGLMAGLIKIHKEIQAGLACNNGF